MRAWLCCGRVVVRGHGEIDHRPFALSGWWGTVASGWTAFAALANRVCSVQVGVEDELKRGTHSSAPTKGGCRTCPQKVENQPLSKSRVDIWAPITASYIARLPCAYPFITGRQYVAKLTVSSKPEPSLAEPVGKGRNDRRGRKLTAHHTHIQQHAVAGPRAGPARASRSDPARPSGGGYDAPAEGRHGGASRRVPRPARRHRHP